MKRIVQLVGVVLGLAAVGPAAAQHYVGVLGGANFAGMSLNGPDETVNTERHRAFAVGGVLGIELKHHLHLHFAPLFVRGGAKLVSNDFESVDMDATTSSIELPLFLRASVGKRVRPFLLAGPVANILLKSTFTALVSGFGFKAEATEIMDRIEWGVGVGAGVEYQLGRTSVLAEVRYCFGVSNSYRGGPVDFRSGDLLETVEYPPGGELSNNGLRVLIGIGLPFGW